MFDGQACRCFREFGGNICPFKIFIFFLQNTFVFGEDDCSQLDKRTGRNSQSGDAKEEMKWRIGRLSFGKQNIQASYLTKIIWKGLYLLMIVSSKTFELYLWLSCFSFGFGFLRTLNSGCFNCLLVYISYKLCMQKTKCFTSEHDLINIMYK